MKSKITPAQLSPGVLYPGAKSKALSRIIILGALIAAFVNVRGAQAWWDNFRMEDADFAGRIAVVTGAWRGLGRAAAARLHERGASVAVNVQR
jgi:hypothetical protein